MRDLPAEAAFYFRRKPFVVYTLLICMRDALMGVGFALELADFTRSIMYENLNMIFLGIAPWFGLFWIVLSLITGAFAIAGHKKATIRGLELASLSWLFLILSYLLNANYLIAISYGLVNLMVTVYTAYQYNKTKTMLFDV